MISVVIPAYNHEKYIGPAIDSVLEQSWQDLELIVIDDGSTDGTAEVVKAYDDPRLHYFYQKNQDAYNTINRGLGMARGEYVAILNSDDVYASDRLERLVETQRKTGAQCIFTDVIPISHTGEEFNDPEFGWNVWHQKNRGYYRKCGDLYQAFLKGNFMVTTSNLFLTGEAVRKVGTFISLRYLHDYDYIFRVMLAFPGQVQYLFDEKLLYYRIHPGNTLSEAAIIGREQDKQVIRKYMLSRLPDEMQPLVNAATDRLLELEHELFAVRKEMESGPPSIKQQVRQLAGSLKRKIYNR